MAKKNLPFKGEFDADTSYLISGKKLIEWQKSYLADRVLPGRGMSVSGTPQGRVIHATASDVAGKCALGLIDKDPGNAGKFRIEPGSITGGGSAIQLTFDNFTPTAGDFYYVEVNWTALEEDDVLLPGGSMNSATIKKGTSYPDDDEFTTSSLTGTFYIPLGWWANNELEGSSCGNLGVSMCPNNPRYWRA